MDSWDAVDDDVDTDDLRDWRQGGRDATLFLIDATEPMADAAKDINDDNDDDDDKELSYLNVAAKAVVQTLKNKVFNAPNDFVGALLFGTAKQDGVRDFKHLSVLLPLQCAGAKAIGVLEAAAEGKGLAKELGHSKDFSLHEALWQCQAMMANAPAKVGTKKVVLITAESAPHKNDKAKANQALQKARDLKDTGVYLDVIGLGKGFDMSVFYKDLVQLADDEQADLSCPVAKLSQLNRILRMRVHKKRTVGKVKLTLGGGVALSVSTYNFVQRAYKPTKQRLAKDTNEEVKSQRKFVHPETGALLMPSEINKWQEYGGKKIEFTQDECKTMVMMEGDVGLRLCGFKPTTALKWSQFVKSGYFIYPSEDLIRGSRQLFAALLDRCLERKVMALCAYKARDSSGPSFVALVPQNEERDADDGLQISPPGFHLVYLPFNDDIRSVPQVAMPEAEPEQVDAAKALIKKLKMKSFHPDAFKNPDLQSHYALIESLALSKEDVEDLPGDDTLPDLERMDGQLQKDGVGDAFLEAVYPAGYNPSAAVPKKRAPAAAKTSDAKRAKKSDVNQDNIDMGGRVKAKSVDKLTVADLKAYLTDVKVNVGKMKKAELVQAVYDYFENK